MRFIILSILCSFPSSHAFAEAAPSVRLTLLVDKLRQTIDDGASDLSIHECNRNIDLKACLEAESKSESLRLAKKSLPKSVDEFSATKIVNFKSESELLSLVQSSKSQDAIQVFKHASSPIYFLKFRQQDAQDMAFGRVANFVEGNGEISPLDGAEGHDYQGHDLASFFNRAEQRDVILNAFEQHLLEGLLKAGLLQKAREEGSKKPTYIATENAAFISAVDQPATISHELSHAVYFTDGRYRSQIQDLYLNGLTADEKRFVDKVMSSIGEKSRYNFKNDKELFITEFAAFFRDPDELWRRYLPRLEYPESSKSVLQSVAKKVKGRDWSARFYQTSSPPPSSTSSTSR